MPGHLWVLSRLFEGGPIEHESNKYEFVEIMQYVIGMCHQKMIRRLGSNISKICLDSLNSTKDLTFPNANTTFPDSSKASESARRADRALLLGYVHQLTIRPKRAINIPNIEALRESARLRQPVQLYTRDTCAEFHTLLLHLLRDFQEGLGELRALVPLPDPAKPKPPPARGPDIRNALSKTFLAGDGLYRMAHGTALKAHILNMAMSLNDPRLDASISPTTQNSQSKDDVNAKAEDVEEPRTDVEVELTEYPQWSDEVDEFDDFRSRSYGVHITQVYLNWFRLIVAHFDAVNIVKKNASPIKKNASSVKKINVKILVAPTVTNEYLPWRELFADSKFFGNTDQKTCDRISRFLDETLQKRLTTKDACRIAKSILSTWTNVNPTATVVAFHELMELCVTQQKRSFLQAKRDCKEKELQYSNGDVAESVFWEEANRWHACVINGGKILDALKIYWQAKADAARKANKPPSSQLKNTSSGTETSLDTSSGVAVMDASSAIEVMDASSGAEVVDALLGVEAMVPFDNSVAPTLESIANALSALTTKVCAETENNQLPFTLAPVKGFTGTLHCEACLASILHPETRELLGANPQYARILLETAVRSSLLN